MPEGPEIRRAADRIASVLVGQRVVDVYFGLPGLRKFERKLAGSVVTAVDTRGKAMLTRFDNGLTLYSHNQLYGIWMTARQLPGQRPGPARSASRSNCLSASQTSTNVRFDSIASSLPSSRR